MKSKKIVAMFAVLALFLFIPISASAGEIFSAPKNSVNNAKLSLSTSESYDPASKLEATPYSDVTGTTAINNLIKTQDNTYTQTTDTWGYFALTINDATKNHPLGDLKFAVADESGKVIDFSNNNDVTLQTLVPDGTQTPATYKKITGLTLIDTKFKTTVNGNADTVDIFIDKSDISAASSGTAESSRPVSKPINVYVADPSGSGYDITSTTINSSAIGGLDFLNNATDISVLTTLSNVQTTILTPLQYNYKWTDLAISYVSNYLKTNAPDDGLTYVNEPTYNFRIKFSSAQKFTVGIEGTAVMDDSTVYTKPLTFVVNTKVAGNLLISATAQKSATELSNNYFLVPSGSSAGITINSSWTNAVNNTPNAYYKFLLVSSTAAMPTAQITLTNGSTGALFTYVGQAPQLGNSFNISPLKANDLENINVLADTAGIYVFDIILYDSNGKKLYSTALTFNAGNVPDAKYTSAQAENSTLAASAEALNGKNQSANNEVGVNPKTGSGSIPAVAGIISSLALVAIIITKKQPRN